MSAAVATLSGAATSIADTASPPIELNFMIASRDEQFPNSSM
jgi:hypothetical protein